MELIWFIGEKTEKRTISLSNIKIELIEEKATIFLGHKQKIIGVEVKEWKH